ncbi:MAG: hypothetical protein HZLCBSQH_000900 [Candidatus Fervidibacterota bacterium]
MKINLIVIKTMKLFLSLLLFLLICFGIWIFLVISIEVAKIYFVMKYLKYPITSQIALIFHLLLF